jgi:peroxiredoxin
MTAPTRTPYNPLRLLIALAALAAAVVIVIAAGLPERADYTGNGSFGLIPIAPEVGAQAPDFTVETLDGETVTLAGLRGQTVVLNFWATWCGPCRVEMPDLQAFADRAGETVRLIAINQGEAPETVRQWAAELGLTFPIGLDPAGEAARPYHLRGLPSTYIIAPDGTITRIFYGPADQAALAVAAGIE